MLINMFGILVNPNEIAAVYSKFSKQTLRNQTHIILRCGKEIELNDNANLEDIKKELKTIN